jgi:hypothetical protein
MELKPHEIEALSKHDDALELLADWHDVQIAQADAINDGGIYDASIKYHEERKAELLAEVKRLRDLV